MLTQSSPAAMPSCSSNYFFPENVDFPPPSNPVRPENLKMKQNENKAFLHHHHQLPQQDVAVLSPLNLSTPILLKSPMLLGQSPIALLKSPRLASALKSVTSQIQSGDSGCFSPFFGSLSASHLGAGDLVASTSSCTDIDNVGSLTVPSLSCDTAFDNTNIDDSADFFFQGLQLKAGSDSPTCGGAPDTARVHFDDNAFADVKETLMSYSQPSGFNALEPLPGPAAKSTPAVVSDQNSTTLCFQMINEPTDGDHDRESSTTDSRSSYTSASDRGDDELECKRAKRQSAAAGDDVTPRKARSRNGSGRRRRSRKASKSNENRRVANMPEEKRQHIRFLARQAAKRRKEAAEQEWKERAARIEKLEQRRRDLSDKVNSMRSQIRVLLETAKVQMTSH